MSSSMIHLTCARFYRPDATPLFFIGNIAPDCIDIRDIKDHTHFRDRTDRYDALREFKSRLDLSNDFDLGMLLHLYLDLKWDEIIQNGTLFRADFYDGDTFLFRKYRGQISLATQYLYHKYDWSGDVWNKMELVPEAEYSRDQDFPPADIKRYIQHVHRVHEENNPGNAGVFNFDFLESFCRETAENFRLQMR